MKKIASVLVFGILLCIPFSFSSCDKLKELLNFKIEDNYDVLIDIPPTAAPGGTTISTVPFNLKAEIDKNNTTGKTIDLSMLNLVTIKSVQIEIVSGANTGNSFANFTDGGILISSNATATTQGRVSMVSFMDNPDVFSTHLEVPVTGASSGKDFKEYLQGTSIDYIYTYVLRRALTTTLHCKIHLVYELNFQG
jgi:hypothetical protein